MSKKEVVPPNETGGETNTERTRQFESTEGARAFFQKVKERLLDVNSWQGMAGTATARFQLTDAQGREVQRHAQKEDHFKIDIPGPGPETGEGYDWVRVEAIEQEERDEYEMAAIRVRPASNPRNDRSDIAHFFTEEASSCFLVKREKNKVTAGVYGRNEKPNTAAETLVDKARNTAVAAGAMTGFSKLQWKSLVNGLMEDGDKKE